MRVIAGAYGGRVLVAPAGRGTRPTSDRVREALFSMLGELEGTVVLDLFAGTGAMGIEALSRGATLAVEKYGKSFGLDQKAQELTAEKLIPLVATDETIKNGLFTMSKAGIDANIEIIKAAGLKTTAEELFDTSVLEEAFAGKTSL